MEGDLSNETKNLNIEVKSAYILNIIEINRIDHSDVKINIDALLVLGGFPKKWERLIILFN